MGHFESPGALFLFEWHSFSWILSIIVTDEKTQIIGCNVAHSESIHGEIHWTNGIFTDPIP